LLNYGTIILISKKENAIQIQQYRTICLLNVSSNIFTNIDTNILEYSNYTNTNCFHAMEAYTGCVTKKIDFEKVYGKAKWSFLQQVMRMKCFDPKWCQWIDHFRSRWILGIKLNDNIDRTSKKKMFDGT
jgi:hypothetical protein